MKNRILLIFYSVFSTSFCLAQIQEATALTGEALYQILDSKSVKAKKDSLTAVAHIQFKENPQNLDNIIWYGRRLAYQTQYADAIEVYTKGIKRFPKSPELYRHRGHRYISIRKLDKAIADFEVAAKLAEGRKIEIEPDGIPNKLNQPLSSLQFNIYYHWALAYYLKGDFAKATTIFEDCINYSINPDLLVATVDWLYMCYQRTGQKDKAKAILQLVPDNTTVIENDAYLKRIMLYKGKTQAQELIDLTNPSPASELNIITQGYGVGNWYLYNGQEDKAKEIFKKIVATSYWPAFGYIAAEAELSR
ncbi:MAG: tetratricopeptide repeat protein [Saprospiraceae bacterium]|jgi:tetratricopeptide (TPR) repeat protein|nr:tetratricopeptide repeat protein [Saprospiraceae bacterium]